MTSKKARKWQKIQESRPVEPPKTVDGRMALGSAFDAWKRAQGKPVTLKPIEDLTGDEISSLTRNRQVID